MECAPVASPVIENSLPSHGANNYQATYCLRFSSDQDRIRDRIEVDEVKAALVPFVGNLFTQPTKTRTGPPLRESRCKIRCVIKTTRRLLTSKSLMLRL